ncbi:ureidoglycolate lyase [Spirulina sp. CS-785/01]|uniref:ureidoglycolate lyase n=1 Tax=Spirulina sp. CS-785/01 TaxID=3021716 RepID=UPI003FA70252
MTQIIRLLSQPITPANFTPFGQVIFPTGDGKPFDETDAQLDLSQGIPRFYIMQLEQRGMEFSSITRHQRCTQCLGALEGKDWYIAVAPPCEGDKPKKDEIAAFHIPGHCFIKLNHGTWHAGPYFSHPLVNFYNLELSDTNEVDHFTHDFQDQFLIWQQKSSEG